jgi:endogenous inhibitor of DNA gyrase (YacG/DUF329 family)
VILVTYTCEHCTSQFDRRPKKNGYRFCSTTCSNLRQTKVTPEKVIAADLDVVYHTVKRALRAHGLHRAWSLNRYKKCAAVAA